MGETGYLGAGMQFITPPFEPEINLKDFGLGVDCIIKIKQQGAKNTEQQLQPDSDQ